MSSLDHTLTNWLQENIGKNKNPWIANAPYYFGLVPYELYVLPGMFLAICLMLLFQVVQPMQFHLLPHWFAFSISLYLKHNVHRIRPGCEAGSAVKSLIDSKHCSGSTKHQSFPSGHTMIAFSLLTACGMFLYDTSYSSADKTLFGVPFDHGGLRFWAMMLFLFVAINVGIHRVSYGYHHVSDVLIGAALGSMIGFCSYVMCNKMRGVSISKEGQWWTVIRYIGIALSVLGIGHFFLYKFAHLTSIQH